MDAPTPYETMSLVLGGIHPAAPREKVIEVCSIFGDHPEEQYKEILTMLQDALETAGVARGNWANVIQQRR